MGSTRKPALILVYDSPRGSESTNLELSSKMIHLFVILLLYLSKCSSDDAYIKKQNQLKIIQAGDDVYLTCILPKESRVSIVWVKQRLGEQPLVIASVYQGLEGKYENDFDKQNRFFVKKDESTFNLSITNTDESDSATYYCVTYVYEFKFENITDLIVQAGQLNIDSDYQKPALDPESPEEHLQCTVITQSCAEKHNVYWFRHESAESPPGLIYTQESRSVQCERSSDLNSTAHKCIYNLPKTNQDQGIYYCAVATCGEILFGEGRKVGIAGFESPWNTVTLVLAISNILAVIVIMFLGTQLYKLRLKDTTQNIHLGHLMDEDGGALNYAALSFQQKPSTFRRPREN